MTRILGGLLLLLTLLTAPIRAAEPVRLFAAASLGPALDAVIAAAPPQAGPALGIYGGSGALARQILAGAPADIFVSANVEWMDALEKAGRLLPDTRRVLLGNHLVLIVPAGTEAPPRGDDLLAWLDALAGKRIGLGEPDSVPAGAYARAALEGLGRWPDIAAHAVYGESVHNVLLWVGRGEVAAGFVYATDARLGEDVRVAAPVPAALHPPIVYPAAIMAEAERPEVRAFFAFLTGPEAAAIFRRFGFVPLSGMP